MIIVNHFLLSDVPFSQISSLNYMQIFLFVISVFAGCILGFFFDFIYGFVYGKKILSVFSVVVFIFAYILFLRFFSFFFTCGEYRFYYTAGNISGFLLWEFTLGIYIRKTVIFIFKLIEKIVCLVCICLKKIVGNAKNNSKIKNK